MRLTIVNQFYAPDISPTAQLAASLGDHRAELGDEVTVVTGRGGYVAGTGELSDSDRENPHIRRCWTPRLGKGSLLRRLVDYGVFYLQAARQLLRLPRQDVIIAMTTPPYIAWVGVLHKLLHPRTRLILWNMDCYPDVAERLPALRPGRLPNRVLRLVNRLLFRRLDYLVCLDSEMLWLLRSRYAPKHRQLPAAVIPNWERASFFPPVVSHLPHTPLFEAKAEAQRGELVVLYTGNMGCGHRFDTVIEAAKTLRGEPVKFLFVGGGNQWRVVEEAKRQHRLANVELCGYVSRERARDYMAEADCALITLRDGMLGMMSPSKLHANLAMRLPVVYIGPENSNVDEAIRRFGCGISLRHGEVADTVDFLRTLIRQPGRLAAFRSRARRAFETAYCDTQTLPQFDAAIGECLGIGSVDAGELLPQRKAA